MKSGNNVLVSGGSGFLLSNCLGDIPGNIINYVDGGEYTDIQMVIHFASPSDVYEFTNKSRMAYTMVDYSLGIFREALRNNAKFVFASTCGISNLLDEYSVYKKFLEQYIQAMTDDHLIYRIPRVYGRGRSKGLMKKIKNGDIYDYDAPVEYIDIEDFKVWFHYNLNNSGIIEYSGQKRINTIREIKTVYVE